MPIKSKSGRIFDLPSPEEEAKIRAGIASAPETCELSDDMIQKLRPISKVKRVAAKQLVSLQLSAEVVAYFKATGKDWQTRVDEVLKEYINLHQ
jgi:uncharacterized protein (DUF4415 family)